jgi:uncharacterized membrane protein
MKHCDVGGLAQLYAVRIAALLAYALLAFRAVSVSAKLSWLFVITALTPMALTEAASASGDGLVIGFALIFFALLGKGACTAERLTRGELAELALSAAALTLCKPVYGAAVLCLPTLSFAAPYRMWKSLSFSAGVAIVSAALYLAWVYLNRNMTEPPDVIYDAGQQLAALRDDPLHTFVVAFRTMLHHGDELLLQSVFVRRQVTRVARFTGAAATFLHYQISFGVALGSLKRSFPGGLRARRASALLFFATWLAQILAVAGALYVCCTRIGAGELQILQGRYFIPALPALLLALALIGRPLFSRWLCMRGGLKIIAIVCLNNVLCLLSLIGWHYYPPDFAWPF